MGHRGLLLLAAAALAVALVAMPAAGANGAKLLKPYPKLSKDLRAAYLVKHKGATKGVLGPLKGRQCLRVNGLNSDPTCSIYVTLYASYRTNEYALAYFWTPTTGVVNQPERFTRKAKGTWRDLGESEKLPGCLVPKPVATVWQLSCPGR